MRARPAMVALLFVLFGTAIRPALGDVVIPYNEYSASPTIGRGNGTSTDPTQPGYGAIRIFIQKVMDYTGALPGGQKVTFRPDRGTGRAINALRAGVQFANQGAQSQPVVSEPSWGFAYNSVPFSLGFTQMLEFLHNAKVDDAGRNGIQLAQALLDGRGGTQVVFPVVGSTMQGSGYFPRPIGKPVCHAGDTDCQRQGDGIGLVGFCTSGWRIRYLPPPEDILSHACDMLVKQGAIPAKTLTFYPAVGGQSVLVPMQKGAIQGFEFITPVDDLVDFFPVKDATPSRPLGNPESGNLDCGPAAGFPMPRHQVDVLAEHRADRRALRALPGMASAVLALVDARGQDGVERAELRATGRHPESGSGVGDRELPGDRVDRLPEAEGHARLQ